MFILFIQPRPALSLCFAPANFSVKNKDVPGLPVSCLVSDNVYFIYSTAAGVEPMFCTR